jgi:aminopeptidase N
MKRIIFLLIVTTLLVQCAPQPYPFAEGVSRDLAKKRSEQIKKLSYNLDYRIPANIDSLCTGTVKIEFVLTHTDHPIVIDFRAPEKQIKRVTANSKKSILYTIQNGHIIIPSEQFASSDIAITIDFESTNTALNRNKEYLYTLFVPDRASTAFPCFDQPDIKATYQLNLHIPNDWTAVSNSPSSGITQTKNHTTYQFKPTAPISTYLFSFVAGKFNVITKQQGDKTIRLFHREKDAERIAINQEKIFKLQFESLKWLENYTNYKHPFAKLDIVAIPSFQYSGMEHPGAILYRAEKLFLSDDASVRQHMDRANLISHETAHLWFGDLVTMEWFSEVWMKEVFANFLADKIVEEAYPDIDHELNFYLNHFEAAFSIDRTEGANPIQQPLNNLLNAGSLYGPIIYHKSPIVMKQLEAIVTPEKLQQGLRKYVSKYAYANASWMDLINLLNNDFNGDLRNWSNTWVNLPGRPKLTIMPAYNAKQQLSSLIIKNQHPIDTQNTWQQPLAIYLESNNDQQISSFLLLDSLQVQPLANKLEKPTLIIPGAKGISYAHFVLEDPYQERLFTHTKTIKAPLHRAIAYQIAWEHMLEGNTTPTYTAKNYYQALKNESNTQLTEWLMKHLETLCIEWLPASEQSDLCSQFNQYLWQQLKAPNGQNKQAIFSSFMATAREQKDIDRLKTIFYNKQKIANLSVKSRERISLGLMLMLKDQANYDTIKNTVLKQINDEELENKFLLLAKAVSPDKKVRDSLFFSFKDIANREKEPWVAEAIHYLHHPQHPNRGIEYIEPGLNLLEEIQRTGDIFFPAQWLNATFWSHNEPEALEIANTFLISHPNYPEHLKNKILQAIDNTRRKAKLMAAKGN